MSRFLCALLGHRMYPVSPYLARVTGLYWNECRCGARAVRWAAEPDA